MRLTLERYWAGIAESKSFHRMITEVDTLPNDARASVLLAWRIVAVADLKADGDAHVFMGDLARTTSLAVLELLESVRADEREKGVCCD